MTRSLRFLAVLLAVTALGVTACKKAPKAAPPVDYNGVTVDLPKLQSVLSTNSNADVKSQVDQVAFNMRYGDYVKCLMSLDQLDHNDAVTPDQKKVVEEVIGQVKQLANKAPAPPGQ